MAKLIDLHVHSTFSDGTKTPSELVEYAKQKELAAIALTDHDTIDGLEECMSRGKEENIEIVPGVELSADYGQEIHILGFNINYKSQYLQDKLIELKNDRELRNHKMIDKLNQLGFLMTYEEVQQVAKEDFVGRPHVALAMKNKGYVASLAEAFDKYIGDDKIAYFKKGDLKPKEAIEIIKMADGLAFLAHPGNIQLPPQKVEELIVKLKEMGLDGIEVYHSDHNQEKTQFLLTLAKRYNLLISGGSDYHGENKDIIDLGVGKGNLRIEYKLLENMRNRPKK